ncbi:speckle targeted PIP5K1A-regulated poly(A) polymerase-like [Stylophora pistillata]|uniref:speckle targeted PIP5K1A-regulated poly(A) polymerase-like n=1 Tax=Stylophora pistillata TaxID=50429 RepID=UPI000C04A9B6|nr:speckle targeted PIP5K1A-regulated poly(A) polymerase-like [Stylophora pistillata]
MDWIYYSHQPSLSEPALFEENMAELCGLRGKQVSCDVCGVTLPSASLLPTHNNGKKHQRMLKLKEGRERSCRNSIYVRGFQNSGSIEEDLAKYLSAYGKVSNIFLDKDKGVFAIVEFSSEESVAKMLSQLESLPPLHKKHLTVKERTLTKTGFQFKMQKPIKRGHDDSEQYHCGHLGSKEMAKFLSKDLIVKLNSLMKVDEQVNILMQQLCLSDEDIKLRRLVCQQLQEV